MCPRSKGVPPLIRPDGAIRLFDRRPGVLTLGFLFGCDRGTAAVFPSCASAAAPVESGVLFVLAIGVSPLIAGATVALLPTGARTSGRRLGR